MTPFGIENLPADVAKLLRGVPQRLDEFACERMDRPRAFERLLDALRLLPRERLEQCGRFGAERPLRPVRVEPLDQREAPRSEAAPLSQELDLSAVSRCYGLPTSPDALDSPVSPRGYRLLARVPRLPAGIIDRLVDHFGGLQQLLSAGIDDLQTVEGVGELRARSVREGLSRLAESSILERYV